MSEILRAVLDATCVFSAPAFYSVPIGKANNGTVNVVPLSGRLQCKPDRYFLQTGISFYALAGSISYQDANQYKLVSLYNLNNSHNYVSDPNNMQGMLMGENAMNALTLPHYIFWKPNELIGVNMTAQSLDASYNAYCVLTGIEYAR